jgi:hypothetical protein
VPQRRDATNDEAGEGARFIRRCTSNVFTCLKVERGAECVEVNAIRTRDEDEDATQTARPFNREDEASDFNEKEAEWVISRLAELLGWDVHGGG